MEPTRQYLADLPGVEIAREGTRSWLAYVAVGSFFGIASLIVVVGWLVLGLKIDDVIKLLTAMAGVLGGVVGAVVGFYFRSDG